MSKIQRGLIKIIKVGCCWGWMGGVGLLAVSVLENGDDLGCDVEVREKLEWGLSLIPQCMVHSSWSTDRPQS